MSGFTLTYAFLTFNTSTLLGFQISLLSSTLAPSIFSLFGCIYIAEAAGRAMSGCFNAIVICSIADEEMFTADQRFMNNKFKGPLDNVAADTRTNEAKAIEAQKPGRSNRVATKIVEFDQEFNVKSYTLNKSSKEAFKVEQLDEYKPVFNSKK